jgi:S1-C subfamily serine protease
MRRSPPRRPRLVAGALIASAVVAGCADDGPAPEPAPRVVAVAAQACDRPLPSEGLGVVLGDGLVVTAGHVVEGPRRAVTVDGAPATVIAIDARTDLAVLRADVPGAADLTAPPAGAVHVATPTGDVAVELVRTGTLIVDDTTDRARYERQVHTIRPDVVDGTSGAPLVDATGGVVGIVVLANRADGTSYAVTAGEVADLLRGIRSTGGTEPAGNLEADAAAACPD